MYRVTKRTTKKTENHCLKCQYCEVIRELEDNLGTICKCKALNSSIKTEFNSKDFYCMEYRGLNEIDKFEKNKLEQKARDEYSKMAFREYAKKYYSKDEAKTLIKSFDERLKLKESL